MKKYLFVGIAAVLAATSVANADVTGITADDDGDGAIVMYDETVTWAPNGEQYDVSWTCGQYWGPGHVAGQITTDTELDPIVGVTEYVENLSTEEPLIWTDYHITIGMDKDFDILSAMVPNGWTAVITQPTSGQPLPNGGTGWVGTIDYYAGTGYEIPNDGSIGTFGWVMSFIGTVNYCTEQYPTPEPVTAGLLALGGLVFLRRRI